VVTAHGQFTHLPIGEQSSVLRRRPGHRLAASQESCSHFDAILNVDGLSLVAVCDVDAQRARIAGDALGVCSFESYDEMPRYSEFGVVSVCTPSGLHARKAPPRRALGARHHRNTDGNFAATGRQARLRM
jgi:hypothetical protein